MADGANNARFLSNIDSKSKSLILESIAKHYGISTSEALAEVTGSEAEHLLDYLTGPAQRYASVLMQAKGMRGFSRPGEKDMMATRKPKVREKWETVFYEYFHGVPVSIMDSGKIKNDINAILASGADLKVEMPKLVKKYGRFSRPGAKETMAVEDRFYFGKERFAEKNDGWALQSVNVPDWGTHHFPSEAAARKYAVEKGYNYEMRLLYNGKTVAIKQWDNTWSNR
jgi:hypothetical protein